MGFDFQPEMALFLGNVKGKWAQRLRRKLKLSPEYFWGAIGVDSATGSSYEVSRECLPRLMVTGIVYVHICQQPVILTNQAEEVKDALIGAITRSRATLSEEERRAFLRYHV